VKWAATNSGEFMAWFSIKVKEETKEELDNRKKELRKKGVDPSYDDLIRESDLFEEKEKEKERDFMEIF